jgi:hypothetical protein
MGVNLFDMYPGHGRSGPGVQAPAFRPTFYVGLNVQLLGLNVQNFKYLFFRTVALVSLAISMY